MIFRGRFHIKEGFLAGEYLLISPAAQEACVEGMRGCRRAVPSCQLAFTDIPCFDVHR